MRLGKMLGKIASVVAPLPSAILRGQQQKREGEREASRLYEQQQGQIRARNAQIDAERSKVAQERERSMAKLRAGQFRSSRRRVRGGLFGDAQVEPTINSRLG